MGKSNRTVRLGFIGVGGRAVGLIGTLMEMDDVQVCALCDSSEPAMQEGLAAIRKKTSYDVDLYTNHHELLARPDIEGVIIATSWNEHIPIAIDSMRAGKYTGFEVSGAASLQQCWGLVEAYEQTKTPIMLLENCCYGQYELAVLSMIRKGLFGEVVHCAGGYQHDLSELADHLPKGFQRSLHHMKRNGDLYPTHGIGPIAKYLNINRGNRFMSLTSTASKACGLDVRAEELFGLDRELWHHHALGDIVTTVIRCAGGETITISHDTSLPRPYCRGNEVHGTKGIWAELNHSVHLKGLSPVEDGEHKWEPIDNYLDKYQHPIWKRFLAEGVTGGHGGMDYLVLQAFIYSIRNGIETPINVYDAASWMAVTCLSEQSIALGSAPVFFPDFTNGKWVCPQSMPEGDFSLET